MKEIRLELYKLRHKHLFLMVALFLSVEIGWAFMVTNISMSRNPENSAWEMLIATVSSMNGLFLPILSAICVSRICDMEHRGNTWKLLLTISVKKSRLYAAKYIIASIIMLWACILQGAAIAIFDIVNGFRGDRGLLLLRFVAGTILVNMTIIALQQWISTAIKNQAFALSFGMIGSFIGLTADLFPSRVGRIFIWSYYTGLSPVTQLYTDEKMQFIVRDMSSLLSAAVVLIVVGIVFYLAGSIHVSRQEI